MRWSILLSLAAATFAQPLAFDAASVKRSPPMDGTNGPIYVGSRGGPGSSDPGRYTCTFCTLGGLITDAYGVPEFRMVSATRLPEERFHVMATVPAGADRAQFRLMLQRLLAERWNVAVHTEKREMPMCRLTVAPGGSKLQPYRDGEPALQPPPGRRAPGFYYRVQGKTIGEFATVLQGQLRRPVEDRTRLPGKYDFDVWWTFDDSDTGAPTIYSAVQSLGLRLENGKAPVEVIVVDRFDKTPAEN